MSNLLTQLEEDWAKVEGELKSWFSGVEAKAKTDLALIWDDVKATLGNVEATVVADAQKALPGFESLLKEYAGSLADQALTLFKNMPSQLSIPAMVSWVATGLWKAAKTGAVSLGTKAVSLGSTTVNGMAHDAVNSLLVSGKAALQTVAGNAHVVAGS